jgi:hypothetical protein
MVKGKSNSDTATVDGINEEEDACSSLSEDYSEVEDAILSGSDGTSASKAKKVCHAPMPHIYTA